MIAFKVLNFRERKLLAVAATGKAADVLLISDGEIIFPLSVKDEISIRQRGRLTTVRVVQVPLKPPPKAQAATLYETLGIESYEPDPYA